MITLTINALKKRKEELRRKAKAKEFCDGMIDGAVSQLNEAQEKNGGRLPHRLMSEGEFSAEI